MDSLRPRNKPLKEHINKKPNNQQEQNNKRPGPVEKPPHPLAIPLNNRDQRQIHHNLPHFLPPNKPKPS